MIRFLVTVITRNEWSRWVNLADDTTISLAHFNRQDSRDVKAQSLSFIYVLFLGSLFSLLTSVFRYWREKFLIVLKAETRFILHFFSIYIGFFEKCTKSIFTAISTSISAKSFYISLRYRNVLRIHHSLSLFLSKMIRCDGCQKVFTSKRTLYQHIRQKHNKTIKSQYCIRGLSSVVIAIKISLFRATFFATFEMFIIWLEISNVFHVLLYSNAQICSKVMKNKFICQPPRLLFFNALCPITTCKLLVFKLRSMILSKFSD